MASTHRTDPVRDDPWGLKTEADAAGAPTGCGNHGSGRRRATARPGDRARRRSARLVAGAVVSAALVAIAPDIAFAGGAGTPPVSASSVRAVALASGASPLFDSLDAYQGATGGVLVSTFDRIGDGGLATRPDPTVSVVVPGRNKLVPLHPTPHAKGYQVTGTPTIAGNTVVVEEVSSDAEQGALWWDDVATGRSGTAAVPSGESEAGAVPGGWLLIKGETLIDHQTNGHQSTLATFADGEEGTLAGPSGLAVSVPQGSSTVWEYIPYAAPHKVHKLFTQAASGYYNCVSLTTDALGCVVEDSSAATFTALRVPFSGAPHTFALGKTPEFPRLVVTPKVTVAAVCSDPVKTCTLHRQVATGGKVSATTLPAFTQDDIAAVGDELYYGQEANTSTTGGLFRLPDTGTAKPTHVVAAPRAAVAAENVSVSVASDGKGTVTWIDNTKPGIGLWKRTVTAPSGTAAVQLGAADLLGQSGFVTSDATSYGLSLGDGGSTVVDDTYTPQPSAHPVHLVLRSGTKTTTITTSPFTEPGGQDGVAPSVSDAGGYVLFPATYDTYGLYSTSSHHVTKLPSTDIVRYALGGTTLVWEKSDGSIYAEKAGTTTARQLEPPPSGSTFYGSAGLAVTDEYVAWSDVTAAGYVTRYASLASPATIHELPSTDSVTGISLSDRYLGVTETTGTGTELVAEPLAGGSTIVLSTGGSDLAVSDDVAVWLNAAGVPYAAKL